MHKIYIILIASLQCGNTAILAENHHSTITKMELHSTKILLQQIINSTNDVTLIIVLINVRMSFQYQLHC